MDCRNVSRGVCVCVNTASHTHTSQTNTHLTLNAEVCVFLLLMFGLTLPRADSNTFGISCARAFVHGRKPCTMLCWCCVINSSDSRRKPAKTPKKVEDVLVEALCNVTQPLKLSRVCKSRGQTYIFTMKQIS